MDGISVDERQSDPVAFFQEAPGTAAAYRLSLAQRESDNHQLLERELPNLLEAARQSYEQKEWETVIAFLDALQYFLDLRGYWKQSLELNEWAQKAAEALEDAMTSALYQERAQSFILGNVLPRV